MILTEVVTSSSIDRHKPNFWLNPIVKAMMFMGNEMNNKYIDWRYKN